MKSEERFWNIPNTLSLYRLLSFPALLTFIIIGHERLFVIFLVAGLVTDVLDGLIARTFNMQTEIGARLDSTADLGIFISAFLGIYTFKRDTMSEHLWLLITFIILIVLLDLIALIKFGKFPGLHLYSFKIGGYIQGSFFIVLFLWKFVPIYFYFAMIWGILACMEEIIILFYMQKPRSNVKGLYWVLKTGK